MKETDRIRLPFRGRTIPVNEWSLIQTWGVMNELEKRLSRPRSFRASVWGTKRAKRGSPLYESTFSMSKHLANNGIAIVTGGGPGVMEAANAGAHAAENGPKIRSFGLRVRITDEPPNEFLHRVFYHHTFHSRLHNFVRMSSAFVVFDPGVGTLLEVLLVWQLLKEKHIEDVPLVLVGDKWNGLLEWMDNGMVENNCPRSKELRTLSVVPTAKHAIPIVMDAHSRFKEQRVAA